MLPLQPADLDHASNLRESSDCAHKLDSAQTKSAPYTSDHSALHTPRLEGSASALVHHAGIYSASTRQVQVTSPGASTLPTQRDQCAARKNQEYARTQQDGHFWRHSASLFSMAGRNTHVPHRRAHRKRQPGTPPSCSQIGLFVPFCHWHNDPSNSPLGSADCAQAQRNECPLLPSVLFQRASDYHTTKKN